MIVLVEFLSIMKILSYIAFLRNVWHLCQYGNLKVHIPIIAVSLLGFLIFSVARRVCQKRIEGYKDKFSLIKVVMVILIASFYAIRIIYSAIPYNGKLAWKIDEWCNRKTIEIDCMNFYEIGIEGIIEELKEELTIPEELYLIDEFQLSFDKTGEIHCLYAFVYGKSEDTDKTYLIEYDSNNASQIVVWQNSIANMTYNPDKKLEPLLEISKIANYEGQVDAWVMNGYGEQFELVYSGKQIFYSDNGVNYLCGATEDKKQGNTEVIEGYAVSLAAPGGSNVDSVYYIADYQYVENAESSQKEEDKDEDTWYVDSSNGTVNYWLNSSDKIGWRLIVTDASLGSRYYELEKTTDSGGTWIKINENPFSNNLGVAHGIRFYNENVGIIGLSGASQTYSSLFITKDGGTTFRKIELPMNLITELSQKDTQTINTIEEYDFLNIPTEKEGILRMEVTTEYSDEKGLRFESEDYGQTWKWIK